MFPGWFESVRVCAISRLLKNVGEAASARQKWPKKRSSLGVNVHFEAIFNAAMATQVVFQQPVRFQAKWIGIRRDTKG